MKNYSLRDLPYILAGSVIKVRYDDVVDELRKQFANGYKRALTYQQSNSVFFRLVKIGCDGFVKSDLVVRSFPMSEKRQERLIELVDFVF